MLEHFRGSPKFHNTNLRQIGKGVIIGHIHKQTDEQRLQLIFIKRDVHKGSNTD